MPTPLVPHSAAAYARTFRDALSEAEGLTALLTPEQFNWKPSSEEWSVAECLQHLNKMGTGYVEPLQAAVARGGVGGRPPFHYGFIGRKFIAAMSPEATRKLRTFGSMDPGASAYEAANVMRTFRDLTAQFVRICKEADSLDLRRIRVASPFLPLLRLQLGVYLEALSQHELRHIAQARRVARHERFPR